MPNDNDIPNDFREPERIGHESEWAPIPKTPLEAELEADVENPATPPHPGFWWAVLWCMGILLVTQLLPAFFAVFILIFTSPKALKPEQLADAQALLATPGYSRAMMLALLMSQILSLGSAWLSIRLVVGKEWPRILGLRWPSFSHLLLALIGLPGLMVLAIGVDGLAKQVLPSFFDLEQMMVLFSKWPWQVGVLLIGVGPGIGEELWFRGFLGRGLVGRFGIVGGILLTSLLFGAIHLEPRQAVSAMAIGIFLHLSYLATRSLLIPLFLHLVNNSLSILAMHNPYLASLDLPANQIPWHVYLAAVFSVVAVALAFYRSRTLLVEDTSTEATPWDPAFPGVELPPQGSSTRAFSRGPDGTSWLLSLVCLATLIATAIPTVRDAEKNAPPRPARMKV